MNAYRIYELKMSYNQNDYMDFHTAHLFEHLLCSTLGEYPDFYMINGQTTSQSVQIKFATKKDSEYVLTIDDINQYIHKSINNQKKITSEISAISLESRYFDQCPPLSAKDNELLNTRLVNWKELFYKISFQNKTFDIRDIMSDHKYDVSLMVKDDIRNYSEVDISDYQEIVPTSLSNKIVFILDTGIHTEITSLEQIVADGFSSLGSPLWYLVRGPNPIAYGFRLAHFVRSGRGYLTFMLNGMADTDSDVSKIKCEVAEVLMREELIDWDKVLHEGIIRGHIYLSRVAASTELQKLINSWRNPAWDDDKGANAYAKIMNISPPKLRHIATRIATCLT